MERDEETTIVLDGRINRGRNSIRIELIAVRLVVTLVTGVVD